ncbi:ATP-grasp domain-containing protein [bacterium]|nr:ATP-grasp domain-containing protein [candidate division CSSED10-310 bacterium]
MNGVTVAVTGLDARINPYPGLALARCLRGDPLFNGRIIALTYDIYCTGIFRDDLFDAVYIVPYPTEPSHKLLRRLKEINRQDPVQVIIPALDSEIAVYARFRDELREVGIETLLPNEAAVKARYKDNLAGTCGRLNIRTPKTVVISSVEQLDWAPELLAFPMVIKGSLADAHIVHDLRELKCFYIRVLNQWGFPVVLQERLVGEEFDVAALADRGSAMVAAIPMRKFAISERGKASAGVVVDDPDLVQQAEELLKRMHWVGPCEVEMLREAATGRYFLLELNARFPAWIYMAAEAGCNMPGMAVRLAMHQSLGQVAPAAAGHLFFRNRFGHLVDQSMLTDLLNRGGWRRAPMDVGERL